MAATFHGALALLLLICGAACYGEFETPERTTADKAARKTPKAAVRPSAGSGVAEQGAAQKSEPAQSYAEAWQLICAAEKLAQVDPAASRQQRGAQVVRWIVKHVTNKEARYWFISYGEKKEEREALLRAEAARAGIKECALTSLLFPADEPTPAAD